MGWMGRLKAHLTLVGFVTLSAPQMDWFRFAWILGKGLCLSVWTWRGLGSKVIWVTLGSGFLSAGFGFIARKSYTLDCNWKVYVDNYLDGGYHVPYLHKALNSVLDYSEYSIQNGPNYVVQSSPMVASQDASVAETRTGSRADYYWLYPNFMINLYEGVMDTNLVLPLGQEKCLVVFDFFFGDSSEEYKAESVAVSDRVQEEDVGICESVQRGLHSREYGAGRLSVRREERRAFVSPLARSRP